MKNEKPAKLVFNLKSKVTAKRLIAKLKDDGLLPQETEAFEIDALDKRAMKPGNTYILAKKGDRPKATKL